MLVDDSELDNFINQKLLEAHHFARKIYVVTSGKSAFEFLKNLLLIEDPTDATFPSVIFVDINMPIMDGFQFIDQFLKISARLGFPKIVILTSSVSSADRERAEALPGDIIFLNKPLTPQALAGI